MPSFYHLVSSTQERLEISELRCQLLALHLQRPLLVVKALLPLNQICTCKLIFCGHLKIATIRQRARALPNAQVQQKPPQKDSQLLYMLPEVTQGGALSCLRLWPDFHADTHRTTYRVGLGHCFELVFTHGTLYPTKSRAFSANACCRVVMLPCEDGESSA